ncbi:mitochondrial WD40 repeat-containing protein [Andalucia godoyi]|uniref:Mitochondrial WD40 repeat-containing protein n=1 Tax=Andalucia godoyi TaxID=505711 RepID=A0A8K0F0M1_ANDGO|nr:mitochondrial WD40 repeat-containing protein [Andalucia godoyi]|eukprot:ANDGO_02944.mRNA.1 mitochondrial WD40 repeat-containing protein
MGFLSELRSRPLTQSHSYAMSRQFAQRGTHISIHAAQSLNFVKPSLEKQPKSSTLTSPSAVLNPIPMIAPVDFDTLPICVSAFFSSNFDALYEENTQSIVAVADEEGFIRVFSTCSENRSHPFAQNRAAAAATTADWRRKRRGSCNLSSSMSRGLRSLHATQHRNGNDEMGDYEDAFVGDRQNTSSEYELKFLCATEAHKNAVFDVQFNHDGSLLVSASADHTLGVFSLARFNHGTLDAEDADGCSQSSSASSLDGLNSSSSNSSSNNNNNNHNAGPFANHNGAAASLTRIGSLSRGGHVGSVKCVAFSNFEHSMLSLSTIVSGGRDGALCVWDVRSRGQIAQRLERAHRQTVTSFAFGKDGYTAYSCGSVDGDLKLWDVRKWSVPLLAIHPHLHRSLAPHSALFASSLHSLPPSQLAFQYPTMVPSNFSGSSRTTLVSPTSPSRAYGLTTVKVSPDGTRVAVSAVDGWVGVYSTVWPERPPVTLVRGDGSRPSLFFTNRIDWVDNGHLIRGAPDGRLTVACVHSPSDSSADEQEHEWLEWQGHRTEVSGICRVSNAGLVASCSDDRTVRMWNLWNLAGLRADDDVEMDCRSDTVSDGHFCDPARKRMRYTSS